MSADFIPGLRLSRLFYEEAVRPVLAERFEGLAHAAALLGMGSEVLGFDTPMSTDHDWCPGVILFLREEDMGLKPEILAAMGDRLPSTFHGYSTHREESPLEEGTYVMAPISHGPLNHKVSVTTTREFVQLHLGFDIRAEITPTDWLTFPSQRLRSLTSGAVFHDGLGEISELRKRLSWYPHDVWLYLLAAGWKRISQEEHLMGRAGYVGDELGSALIGSRLVRDVMHLCFLMERRYAPYPKWFGTAFKELSCAPDLLPVLWSTQIAHTWQEREAGLAAAYEQVARMHNALGVTPPVEARALPFFGRPFRVIFGERFTGALVEQIRDPEVKAIASRTLIGGVDQFSDSTDLRDDTGLRDALRGLYGRRE